MSETDVSCRQCGTRPGEACWNHGPSWGVGELITLPSSEPTFECELCNKPIADDDDDIRRWRHGYVHNTCYFESGDVY